MSLDSFIGKSVNLLVHINYLQIQVVLTTRLCTIIQTDVVTMVIGLSLKLLTVGFSTVIYRQISSTKLVIAK